MSELNFEKALQELEETVDKLEKGRMTLTESLNLFERGIQLAKYLRNELEKAEKKIEILLKDETGEMKTETFPGKPEDEDEEPGKNEEPSGSGNESLPF
ncbi:MAG: exodeoxyribonuclease VII small subunit [Candidatus Aminicenantaceae bacterium]